MLNGEADMRVVASSGGLDGTVKQVRRLKPHLFLLDLGLRSQNGMRFVAALTRGHPEIKVVGMGLIPSQLDIT